VTSPMEYLILPLLLIGLLWLMSAPQRRMRKEQAAMLERLAPGAQVMTHGGLYGTVVELADDVVVLETSPGVTMRWATRAIARIVEPTTDEDAIEGEDWDEDAEYEDAEYDGEHDEDAEYDDGDEETDAAADDDWPDVEVPDDASSLTDEDDDTGR